MFLAVHTAAMEMLSPDSSNLCRKPEIVSDAVYALLCKDSKSVTGQFLIDEDILKKEGITDFTDYACNPGNIIDSFIFSGQKKEILINIYLIEIIITIKFISTLLLKLFLKYKI